MHKELLALANKRKIRLQDCYQLQQFLFDSDEIRAWISEKTKIASDETYKVSSVSHSRFLIFPFSYPCSGPFES